MTKRQKELLDLSKLTDEERHRVDRALKPRKQPLSLKFDPDDIESWRQAAADQNIGITDWVKDACCEKLEREKEAKRTPQSSESIARKTR